MLQIKKALLLSLLLLSCSLSIIAQTSNHTQIWNKYDFVPADTILFYDDLQNEEYGEFPSKWDMFFGNVEIAKLNNEKVIQFKETRFGSGIFPLMKQKDYLDDYATIELDIFLDASFFKKSEYWYLGFHNLKKNAISFYNKDFLDGEGVKKKVAEYGGKIKLSSSNGYLHVKFGDKFKTGLPLKELSTTKGWHHIAISINKQKLKFYFDNHKLLNIPNIGFNPYMFFLGADDYKNSINAAKNIKVAQGGDTFYNRIASTGNYVTNGILFDSDKAIIKPESSGILTKITTSLTENVDWKLEIIGHTDSDGENQSNLRLSLKRADAIKNYLIDKGINPDRLLASGKGESDPLNDNGSAVEKANNRRVEFILVK